ncbi:MAG: VanZ family protein [Pseudomonadota bacterium]
MKALDLRRASRVLAIACAVAIAFLSLAPAGESSSGLLSMLEAYARLILGPWVQGDKVGHFMAYAGLGCLAAFGIRSMGPVALAVLAATILAYGGTMELLQGLLANRNASLGDLMANTLGMLTGFGTAEGAHALLKRYQI